MAAGEVGAFHALATGGATEVTHKLTLLGLLVSGFGVVWLAIRRGMEAMKAALPKRHHRIAGKVETGVILFLLLALVSAVIGTSGDARDDFNQIFELFD